jgi:hypothetical protein
MLWSLIHKITISGSGRRGRSTPVAEAAQRRVPHNQPVSSTRVSPIEWRFVGIVSLAVLLLTSLPYLFAIFTTPADKQFMGFLINVSDHTQYLSWYKGFQTDHLITNRLTSEENPPLFFNLLWWSLGRLGLYTGLSYVVVYQIFRWLAGAFFLAMVYLIAACFFPDVLRRRIAFLVVSLGAGLGWILVVIKYLWSMDDVPLPLNLYISEGNSFLCILGYPHFAEAAGLILAVFWLLLRGEQQNNLRYGLYAGLVALLLGWQHTYDLIIVWGIPVVYGGVRLLLDRKWPSYWFWSMLMVGLISCAPAFYSVWLTSATPLWKEVLAQFSNAGVFTPTPLHMLILMGIPLIAALITLGLRLRDRLRQRGDIQPAAQNEVFLVVWFIVGWALTYIPTDYQVHMISSWQVPVGLLAVLGLFHYAIPAMKQRWDTPHLVRSVALLFVLLVIPTNLYLIAWRFVDLNRHNYPFFLYTDEVAAINWLEEAAPSESIVFSAYEAGRYIPGLSGQRVFLGHWAQTVDFFNKRDMVAEFFAETTSDTRRQEILQSYDVDYLFYGQVERELGAYQPDTSAFLQPAFTTSKATVYAVNQPRSSP